MTRRDVEMALIQMGKAMKVIVEAYAPQANHINITSVDGQISVNASRYDDDNVSYIEQDILDAVLFTDGTLKICGEYIRPKEGAA